MNIFSGKIDNFEPKTCLQCDDPKCMSACSNSAIYVDEKTRARVVDEELCAGCKLCIEACGQHFDPPRIRFDEGRNIAIKCDLCEGDPQCVRWCPNGALKYVNLSEFQRLGKKYRQDFKELYDKDFGPDFEAFKGNEFTFKKLYPKKEVL